MILNNSEDLCEIKTGTIIKWDASVSNDDMLLAIKPGSESCGKEKPDGSQYGTRPQLISDDGEHILNEEDFYTVGKGINAGIFLKRGKNETHNYWIDEKEYEICISTISFTNLKSKIVE